METINNDTVEINIKELIGILLHRLWIIVLAGALGALIIGLINVYYVIPIYTSTTKIYVIHRQDDSKTTISDLQTGTQLTKDFMILVTSTPVMERVIEELQLDLSPSELSNMVFIVNPDGTRILEISVVHHNRHLAKAAADAIAEAASEQMVDIMEMKKVNIIEQGNLPFYPSSPNIGKNTVMGGFLGVLISSIILIVIRLLNDNIKTADDIEKYLGITILGVIPKDKEDKKLRKQKKNKYQSSVERSTYVTD